MKLHNNYGLQFDFLENGAIKCILANNIRIGLRDANPFSLFGTSIYIRERNAPIRFEMIFGSGANSFYTFENNCYYAKGYWSTIEYLICLQLHNDDNAWLWTIELKNNASSSTQFDIIFIQDVGLKQISTGPVNEYYVSQYIERLILKDPQFGDVVCCRQNMKEQSGNPWLMAACENGSASATTDGINIYGSNFRKSKTPVALELDSLPGECAGESSVIALQTKAFDFKHTNTHSIRFVFKFTHDHPLATSQDDLSILPELFTQFNFIPPISTKWKKGSQNIFSQSNFFPADDLQEKNLTELFGSEMRFPEYYDGKLISFFYDQNRHVVLSKKEELTYRPHGHIIQSNVKLEQNDNIVSLTTWMFGIFNSHLKQGNTNFNTLLSINSSQYNLFPETGQRIFVEHKNKLYQLGIPSAYEMGQNFARWIYKHNGSTYQITTCASADIPVVNFDFKILSGSPVNTIITLNLDELNGWKVIQGKTPYEIIFVPASESLLAKNYPKAQYRMVLKKTNSSEIIIDNGKIVGIDANYSDLFMVVKSTNTVNLNINFICELNKNFNSNIISNYQFQVNSNSAIAFRKKTGLDITLSGTSKEIDILNEIIPWFESNALIHYLTPYGLEQFGGAAWGTRDISQGPIELLLSLGKYDEVKKILLTIFSNQKNDGWWPQWWMFDKYKNIRANEAHGDIGYWCIIALSNYVLNSGDFDILNTPLPYYTENVNDDITTTPLIEHLDRLIDRIIKSFIPGTSLVPFGGGDWNDSLQPVNSDLAKRLVSSWTVEMNYQAFVLVEKVYSQMGLEEKSLKLKEVCKRIKIDFNNHLIKEGIVAGYGLLENNNTFSLLIHPSDKVTGVQYSILPMNRGILSGIFNADQAENHQQIIKKILLGPDGARLMDKPLKYTGGLQNIFQRAESSTFFGREIGLMYVHEHIRYAESLAITGKAKEFAHALLQAIPISYSNVVKQADVRQSNCYYSSSDVILKNRYEADNNYSNIINGKYKLYGGWRVYSSGPGIFTGIIISRLLGFRFSTDYIVIDPVLPEEYDGLKATFAFNGIPLNVNYYVKKNNFSPFYIKINNIEPPFIYEENKYRKGGIKIENTIFLDLLNKTNNKIDIYL